MNAGILHGGLRLKPSDHMEALEISSTSLATDGLLPLSATGRESVGHSESGKFLKASDTSLWKTGRLSGIAEV